MLPLIVDAHEDIAYNILNFGRDYTRAAVETRRLEYESGSAAPEHNGETLLGWPDYQRGRVAVVFSTLFVTPIRRRTGEWDKQAYADFDQAHRLYRTQLDAYHKLEDDHPDHFRLIASRADLETVLTHWADSKAESHPVGLVPLMEGAEGVRTPSELDEWWEWGVRVIGPAWAGTRFCGGTREPGPLTDEGRLLLKAMADIGFTLDLSHMDELSARIRKLEGPDDSVKYIKDFKNRLEDDLTEIITTQSFQDITGQTIKKVILLVGEIEKELVGMVAAFGLKTEAGPLAKEAVREMVSQSDVDDLLKDFGF